MNEAELDTLEDDIAARRSDSLPVVPYLFAVLECDRLAAGGARYSLDGVDEVVIGRGAQRNATYEARDGKTRLVVRLPGRSMSSTHAKIVRTEQGWSLEDMRSTNGSFVNGTRVVKSPIGDRDVIELGHTLFILREAMASPTDTARVLDIAGDDAGVGLTTLLPKLGVDFVDLARFARSMLPLILLGKSGTGKEVVARAIHRMSGRKGPFVAVNCGALAASLVESQLFGHTKGAFSGAIRDEPGFIRSAQGGTLLLDEIGDLPLAAQPSLLRVLQEQEVTPIGSAHPIKIDVRMLCATHQPLRKLMAKNQFRDDLFARLDGHRLYLPELNNRREDLGLILRAMLCQLDGFDELRISPDAGVSLISRHWQFNIRQLVQCMDRALILADGDTIQKQHVVPVTDHAEDPDPSETRSPSTRPLSPDDAALKERLLHELATRHGNVTAVAQAMGKARIQIARWMKRFGIDPEAFRSQSR